MRQILQINIAEMPLVGTYHPPADPAGVQASHSHGEASDIGLLLLNFGQAPRAGLGDLAVRVADRVAQCGYPAFRFDLPGLGDSTGDLPAVIQAFWRYVQDGGHADCAARLVSTLKDRFRLRGLIVGGLCGGAISAIYAADRVSQDVLGLVLLEPEFVLTHVPMDDQQPNPARAPDAMSTRYYLLTLSHIRRDLLSPRAWRRFVCGQSAYREHVRLIRHLLTRQIRRLRRDSLPDDANLPLIHHWRQQVKRNLASLVICAEPSQRQLIQKDILGSRKPPAVSYVEVTGTNHMFVAGNGCQRVTEHICHWLDEHFPVAQNSAAA